jgi:hypothetical protein
MGRYAMWQLELANQLFITNDGKLGPSELAYDADQEIWEYASDQDMDDDDGQYSKTSTRGDTILVAVEYQSSGSGSGSSDLDDFLPEETLQCVYELDQDVAAERYSYRKRKLVE